MISPVLSVFPSPTDVTALIVLGAVLGIVYTLLSEGFGLMYGVGGVLNGAYGALYMVTDYVIFALFISHFPIYAAIGLSLVIVFFLGILIQKYIISQGKSQREVLFLTLGVAFVFQYLVQFVSCSSVFSSNCNYPVYVPIFILGSVSIAGVSVNIQRLAADSVSIIFLILIWVLLSKTKFGSGIRAVSQDKVAADLVGIDSNRTMLLTTGIGTVMAGVASAFAASYSNIDPTIGWSAITLAFAIVILGGLGSLKGAVIASFILAYAQTYVQIFVSSLLSDFVALSILIVVLLLRPKGMFGKEIE